MASTKQVTIIDKFTGKIEYQNPEGNDSKLIPNPAMGKGYISVKMMKNTVFLSQNCGNIIILSKDPLSNNWISREHVTGLQNIELMFGDESFDVLGYGSKECIKFWDRRKESETELCIDKAENSNIQGAQLSYPFVFIIFKGYIMGSIKIYNIVVNH